MSNEKFSQIKDTNKMRYCVTLTKYENLEIIFIAQNYYKTQEEANISLLGLQETFKDGDCKFESNIINNIDRHIESNFNNNTIFGKCNIL